MRARESMGKKIVLHLAGLLFVLVPSAAFGEDAFDPVKVVHMATGEAIYCQMGSIEGTQMVCRKANGSVSVPLHKIDFEKTFPKYKVNEGERVLLVHAGQLYRDEFTIVSNLRMIREEDAESRISHVAILCDVTNRSDPCRIRVSVLAKDVQGNSRFAVDLDSDSKIGKDEKVVLRQRLGDSNSKQESRISALKIGDLERRKTGVSGEVEESMRAKLNSERIREQKIRNLREALLK